MIDTKVTLTIEDAESHATLYDAIAAHICGEMCCRIDLGGQASDPVTVDGDSTPFQNAGTNYETVVSWLHGQGGAPAYVYDSEQQVGRVIEPDDGDDEWRIEWEDIEVEFEGLDAAKKLVAWAGEID